MHFSSRSIIPLSWLGCCILVFSYGMGHIGNPKQNAPQNTHSAVVFMPGAVNIGDVLPGKYTALLSMKNVSGKTLHQVKILSSCTCLVPKTDTSIPQWQNGEIRKVPFTVTVSGRGADNQYIRLTSPDLPGEPFANVLAECIQPLNDFENMVDLPPLKRRCPGMPAIPLTWRTPLAPEAKAVQLSVSVPWLHIHSHQAGPVMRLDLEADGDAPEGTFIVPAELSYTTAQGRQSKTMAVSGRIASSVRAEPDLLTFGAVTAGQPARSRSCVLIADHPLHGRVRVSCEDSRVGVAGVQCSGNQVRFEVKLKSGTSGEIQTTVVMKQDNQLLAHVPVSAFIP